MRGNMGVCALCEHEWVKVGVCAHVGMHVCACAYVHILSVPV